MKRTGPTNSQTRELVQQLRVLASSQNAKIWKRIADDLEKPTRRKRIVNLSKLAKCTKENDNVIIPGKVLASGDLSHKLTIGALQFSKHAKEKLEKNSICLSLKELITQNPKGKNLKIIG